MAGMVDKECYSRLLSLMQGNPSTVGIQPSGENFRPRKITKPVTVEDFESNHIAGKRCLGIYPIFNGTQVNFSCVDFDNHADHPDPEWQEKTERVSAFLSEQEIPHDVEVSSSGSGSHIWIYLSKPADAWLVRAFWRVISAKTNVPMVEVYPRQDSVAEGKLGNLIRVPLWKESRFVDLEEDWETTAPQLACVDPELLVTTAAMLGHRLEPPQIQGRDHDYDNFTHDYIRKYPNSLLAKRSRGVLEGLKDESRSACVMSFTNELVRLHIHPNDIKENVLAWGVKHSYAKCEREDFVDLTISKAYENQRTRKQPSSATATNFLDCSLAYIEVAGTDSYMPFGIPSVDNSIDGVAKGEVCTIMARPSHGKSALGAFWLNHNARNGHRGLMLNAEMSEREQGKRNVLNVTGFDQDYIHNNRNEVRKRMEEYYKDFTPPFFRNVTTIDQIENLTRAYVEGYKIECICIDYAQLIQSTKSSRYEVVTDVSQRVKLLAREMDVAVVLLAQCGRDMEMRASQGRREPQFLLSDLKESGQIEQDSDLVFGLWYWARANVKDANKDCMEMQFLKRRNGQIKTNKVRVFFDAPRQLFREF